jgi:hypothetical protein
MQSIHIIQKPLPYASTLKYRTTSSPLDGAPDLHKITQIPPNSSMQDSLSDYDHVEI